MGPYHVRLFEGFHPHPVQDIDQRDRLLKDLRSSWLRERNRNKNRAWRNYRKGQVARNWDPLV